MRLHKTVTGVTKNTPAMYIEILLTIWFVLWLVKSTKILNSLPEKKDDRSRLNGGFIQIPILIAIIVGVTLLGGGGYFVAHEIKSRRAPVVSTNQATTTLQAQVATTTESEGSVVPVKQAVPAPAVHAQPTIRVNWQALSTYLKEKGEIEKELVNIEFSLPAYGNNDFQSILEKKQDAVLVLGERISIIDVPVVPFGNLLVDEKNLIGRHVDYLFDYIRIYGLDGLLYQNLHALPTQTALKEQSVAKEKVTAVKREILELEEKILYEEKKYAQ